MLELVLDAELSSLRAMADSVEVWAAEQGVAPEKIMQLVLALDEIVTNIISYGGLGAGDRIGLTADVQGDRLLATVEDPGPAFDPLSDAPPPHLSGPAEDRPTGGLGLHIVRTIMEELSYERVGERNRLVMQLAL
jgi:serine/threonine-protein kinase RsbW